MTPYYEGGGVTLYLADCRDVLPALADASVDAVVTDPPAGVSFMGKSWDSDKGGRHQWIAWLTGVMAECKRVIRPGAYAFVWALPRTSHWTATAIEDAGLVVRDIVTHHFGSGFPKGQACLKPASEHWILAWKPAQHVTRLNIDACRVATTDRTVRTGSWGFGAAFSDDGRIALAKHINGGHPDGRWPSNLVLTHSASCERVGTRRIRGSRIETPCTSQTMVNGYGGSLGGPRPARGIGDAGGMETVDNWRCAPDCPVAVLDQQSGELTSGARSHKAGDAIADNWHALQGRSDVHHRGSDGQWEASAGGASRFFPTFRYGPEDAPPFLYCAKASRSERDEGLQDAPDRVMRRVNSGGLEHDPRWAPVAAKNHHVTVKPIELVRWLVRLITPAGGLVLDPFAGSGTTGVAAIREGMRFIGIEQEDEYVEIAQGRIAHAVSEVRRQPSLFAAAEEAVV